MESQIYCPTNNRNNCEVNTNFIYGNLLYSTDEYDIDGNSVSEFITVFENDESYNIVIFDDVISPKYIPISNPNKYITFIETPIPVYFRNEFFDNLLGLFSAIYNIITSKDGHADPRIIEIEKNNQYLEMNHEEFLDNVISEGYLNR